MTATLDDSTIRTPPAPSSIVLSSMWTRFVGRSSSPIVMPPPWFSVIVLFTMRWSEPPIEEMASPPEVTISFCSIRAPVACSR